VVKPYPYPFLFLGYGVHWGWAPLELYGDIGKVLRTDQDGSFEIEWSKILHSIDPLPKLNQTV